jgi:ABC-type Zn2+ transport system substrate-binding protein/surface adhesin
MINNNNNNNNKNDNDNDNNNNNKNDNANDNNNNNDHDHDDDDVRYSKVTLFYLISGMLLKSGLDLHSSLYLEMVFNTDFTIY